MGNNNSLYNHDLNDVKKALEKNKNLINNKDSRGETPLLYHCSKSNWDIVEFLVENKADINDQNFEGKTPLMYAIKSFDLEKVKFLVENKANLEIKDNNGYTALLYSIYCDIKLNSYSNYSIGFEKISKFLIENGANINTQNLKGETPLMYCFEKLRQVEFLVKNKADLNIEDVNGNTCLSLALKSDRPHIFFNVSKFLLENKAEFKQILFNNCIGNNDIKRVEILVKLLKVDINIQDDNKNTALILACENNNLEYAKFLVENKADLNIQNRYNDTALIQACAKGCVEIVKFLVNNKADLNIQNICGYTALMSACYHSANNTIVNFLLENKADLNIQNINGDTALSLANTDSIIRILVNNNADINFKDNNGNTHLILACKKNNIEMVQFLVEKGANILETNNTGKNALHAACIHTDIHEYLTRILKTEEINNHYIKMLNQTNYQPISYIMTEDQNTIEIKNNDTNIVPSAPLLFPSVPTFPLTTTKEGEKDCENINEDIQPGNSILI